MAKAEYTTMHENLQVCRLEPLQRPHAAAGPSVLLNLGINSQIAGAGQVYRHNVGQIHVLNCSPGELDLKLRKGAKS